MGNASVIDSTEEALDLMALPISCGIHCSARVDLSFLTRSLSGRVVTVLASSIRPFRSLRRFVSSTCFRDWPEHRALSPIGPDRRAGNALPRAERVSASRPLGQHETGQTFTKMRWRCMTHKITKSTPKAIVYRKKGYQSPVCGSKPAAKMSPTCLKSNTCQAT